MRRALPCPSPRFILSRGDNVYAACFGRGAIRVFSQSKGFAPVNEVEVGVKDVYYLSAPLGQHFKGDLLAACDNAPVPFRLREVEAARSMWASHHLTRYAYVYETTGFFIGYDGRPIRLVILNDSVNSAQDMTTDSLLPPGAFPTLDGLFYQAMAALSSGTLYAITFDSTFGYPSRMDLMGPADGSGSILASNLELLP